MTNYNRNYLNEIKFAFKWDETSYLTSSTYEEYNTLDTTEIGKDNAETEFAAFNHENGVIELTLADIEDAPDQVNVSATWGSDDVTITNNSAAKIVSFLREGNDTLTLESDADARIYAGGGNDEIHTSNGNDEIYGENGNDDIYSHAGNDYISGGYGNDDILGGGGNDTLFGDDGKDTIYGGEGSDTLKGGEGKDILYGENGIDFLYGGNDNDQLYGGADRDKLFGNDGKDTLVGGDGHDVLSGGDRSDLYLYESFDGLDDEILDFETGKKGDELDISDILSGYSKHDDINDYLQLTVIDENQTDLLIDQSGSGENWTRLVFISDDLTGSTLDSLIDDGNIVI